jgi:hypothetical protein
MFRLSSSARTFPKYQAPDYAPFGGRDVESNGILGLVKAKFIPNSRAVKIDNYRCADC